MTKLKVLSIFDHAWGFLTPDQIRARLQPRPDRRSVYTYLLRLHHQGLLERRQARRGTLAYRLTERGRARLRYFQQRDQQG
jgi:DNA-binding PadR family transcriptional regulator